MTTLAAPTVVIESRGGLLDLDIASLWQHRELLYFLVWRDVKVRYKQTVIGIGWAIMQPVMTMLIFTIVFGQIAKIPSNGVPYPVFAFTALLPWTYFAEAMRRSGTSLVSDAGLVGKVYFPRLLIPMSSAVRPIVDFGFSLLALTALMAWFEIRPSWAVLALPFFMGLAFLTALTMGVWLSPINVRYRDVAHAIPFVTQLWMYASPVVYPVSLVPAKWRLLYMLNPMAGAIEGFRWALLGTPHPDFAVIGISTACLLSLLLGGAIYFRRMDRTFADVI